MGIQTNIPSYGNIFFVGDTYAELSAIKTTKVLDGYAALIKGRLTASDREGGMFFWHSGSTLPASANVIVPDDGGNGRWIIANEGVEGPVGPRGPVGIFDNPVTDKFVGNLDGAQVNKIGDRVFVGGAAGYDGNYPNDTPSTQDWYTKYERAQGRGNGIIVSSQMAVLTNNYSGAAVGLTVAARTSNLNDSVGGAVGGEFHVVNDKTSKMHDAWALYSEATRDSEGVGAIITYEADSRNKGLFHPVTPWNQSAKQSVVFQVASGGALTGVGCEDISAGMNFRHNPTKMGAGIVFGNNALRGTDGLTGYGNAIVAATRQRITWMNAADEEVSHLTSTVTTASMKNGIEFANSGTIFLGPSQTTTFLVAPVANSVNYMTMIAGATGVQPYIQASGPGADIDLKLNPKGAGCLQIGNAASFVAPGTGTPVFTNSLPAGLSTTPKKWLAIHGAAGEFYAIPLFGI